MEISCRNCSATNKEILLSCTTCDELRLATLADKSTSEASVAVMAFVKIVLLIRIERLLELIPLVFVVILSSKSIAELSRLL